MANVTDIKITATDATERAFNSVKSRFSKITALAGKASAAFAVIGGAAAFGSALKTSAEFDDQMREVQATLGLTGREGEKTRNRLASLAREMGSTTAFSASQAAEGLKFLAMAGMSVEEQMASLPDVLNLASAGGIELGQAADIASDIMSAFGIKAENMSRVTDVLAKTAASANTDIGGLGEAMKFVAPVAAQANIPIETVSAAIGKLADNGIKGSEAGTALRGILLRLTSTPKEAADALDSLGIATKDADGNFRELSPLLAEINDKLAAKGTADKLALAKAIFGTEQSSAGLVISANAASGALDELDEKLFNAAGTAKQASETMEGGAGGALRKLNSAIESISISLGTLFLPILADIADFVAGGLSAIAGFFSDTDEKMDKSTKTIKTLGEKTEKTIKTVVKQTEAIEDLNKETKAITKEEKKRTKQAKKFEDTLKTIVPDTEKLNEITAITNEVITQLNGEQGLGGIADSFYNFYSEVRILSRAALQDIQGNFDLILNNIANSVFFKKNEITSAFDDLMDDIKSKFQTLKAEEIIKLDTDNKIVVKAIDAFKIAEPIRTGRNTNLVEVAPNEAFALNRSAGKIAVNLSGFDFSMSGTYLDDTPDVPRDPKFTEVDFVSKGIFAETGGFIAGQRHRNGGVNINAEDGEYIINRKDVARIGRANLDRLNNGGGLGGGVEVNIYDGTGQRINEYDSALRVEIKERAERNGQFSAVR